MNRAIVLAAAGVVALAGCEEPRTPVQVPSETGTAPAFVGAAFEPHPVEGAMPPHPYLAAAGRATMHADAYNSNVHPAPGPLGHAPSVRSRSGSRLPGGECATHVFDRQGRLIVLCGNLFDFTLELLDPASLELLAQYTLPGRPSTLRALLTFDPDKIMSDTSGAYFYLDAEDRIVIADSRASIRRIALRDTRDRRWQFEEDGRWDLSGLVQQGCATADRWLPWRNGCDVLTAVMPDHDGRIWWVTRRGRVGTLDPATGAVASIQLDEEIQNGFSVAADGVYVVSDHALYRLAADANGVPRAGWRETYDRGSARKVGSISQGSGSTPTLIGDRYVAITDNADPRINLLVFRRDPAFTGRRLICQVPLFGENASASDNSPIGWGRSIVVENNSGYHSAFQQEDWSAVAGGVTRVDIRADESGCDVAWNSRERVPSLVAKLSAPSGLLYYYTFEAQPDGQNAWYLTAIDFATGHTAFKVLTGIGRKYDNNWASMSLGPDGTAYVGVLAGLVAVRDTQ